jgi:hypothetical protein
MCIYCQAKHFDALMFSYGNHFARLGIIAGATQPHSGNRNLGTLGIKSNIERSKAINIMRRNTARIVGLDVEQIGKIKYRAASLEKLQQHIQQNYGENQTSNEGAE